MKKEPKKEKKDKNYFTSKHEKAIIQYSKSKSQKKREKLYVEIIGPVLEDMVSKIIFTYKFNTLPNIDSLKEECCVWLVTVLDKFEVDRGFKAFSYFSVITKNYFIHRVKRNNIQIRKEIQYSDMPREIENGYMVTNNNYLDNYEKEMFWKTLRGELDRWEVIPNLRVNEKKVINAIKILFDNIDDIEIFNKKAFFLYLRELTSLSTKQIVSCLNKIKERYRIFKTKWDTGHI